MEVVQVLDLSHSGLSKWPYSFFQWDDASSGVRIVQMWGLALPRASRISCIQSVQLVTCIKMMILIGQTKFKVITTSDK